jgi:hypothetical protein
MIWTIMICLVAGKELLNYDPQANPKAMVVSGNARFTVLTPELIRIEYSTYPGPKFEDRATVAFVNRFSFLHVIF